MHGLRRTNDDKRMAVSKLLKDKEWSKWSDNKIAKICHVDNHTVMRLRKSLGKSPSERRTYTTRHGKTATMKTGKIGKSRSPAKPKMPAQMQRDMEPYWISSAMLEITEQLTILQKEYPQASQAVTAFPIHHRHVFTSSRLDDMAKWLTEFAWGWESWERTTRPPRTNL